jgi:protein AATF/BFR2
MSKLGGHIFVLALRGLRCFSRPSELRLQLDSIVDPKYVGTKISRKQLEEDNALGTAFVDSLEQGTSASQSSSSEGSSGEEDEEEKGLSPGEEEIASEDERPTLRHNQDIEENPSHEKDLSTTVRQRRDEDREKGKVVTKQLVNLDE